MDDMERDCRAYELEDQKRRTTTVNIRASHTEKERWQQAALQAGFQHHENGKPVGSISKWLRSLAEANTAGGKA